MTMRYRIGCLLLLPAILLPFPSAYALSDDIDFEIKIDPRIELLAVIQSLTPWAKTNGFTHLDFQYYRDVKNYFAPHKNHRAVKWMADNIKKNFCYDAPPAAMLHLSDPPDLKANVPFSDYLLGRGRGETNLNTMIECFNEFAKDSNFMKFWEDQQPFYKEYVNRVKGILPYEDYARLMMNYYGEKRDKFVFIAAPLFHGGGYGTQLDTMDGKTTYYLGGSQVLDDGFPVYLTNIVKAMVFHEFGHSFVSPVVKEFNDPINEYRMLHKHIKVDSAYGAWPLVCEEHLIRTGEALLLRMAGFPEEADRNLKANIYRGFVLIPFFVERMEIYLQNRDRYPTFKSFFPEILRVFEEVKIAKSEGPVSMGAGLIFEGSGFRVTRFSSHSPLKKIGIKAGDRLLKINETNVTENDLYKALDIWKNAKKGESVRLLVSRNGKELEFAITVPFGEYYKFIKK
jgi:hypothetical protein